MLPAAVFFDLDGTLVDSEGIHVEGMSRFLAEHGIVLDAGERDFVIGHGWKEIHAHLRVQERLGLGLGALQRGTQVVEDIMRGEGLEIRSLPGAVALIELIEGLGIPRCIVSGSSRSEIAYALTRLGVASRFEFTMGAEDYARGKPAPDGYLGASRRLRLAPDRCLVIEDSRPGIESARAAGMAVIATSAALASVERPENHDQSAAHHVVASLTEVNEDLLRDVMHKARNP